MQKERKEFYDLPDRMMSAEQVAREMGITRQYVLQLEKSALAKLRVILGARFQVRAVDDILPDQHGEAMQPPAIPRR